jgi:hypothetical protein
MKIATAILLLFLSAKLSAQKTDSLEIDASDPTQFYSFVEGYGGFNFLGQNNLAPYLDTWELGFRGSWAIKKFRLGVYFPMSNNTGYNRVFDDISADAGYQIHNNTGLYNASVINAGFVSPSHPSIFFDIAAIYDYAVYPNSSGFLKYYFNYVGALKFSQKWSFYPGVEWFQRKSLDQSSVFTRTNTYYAPRVTTNGLKLFGTVSYTPTKRSFLQFYAAWSTENWEASFGEDDEFVAYLSQINEVRVSLSAKYQYAITPAAQVYAKVQYNDLLFNDGIARTASMGGVLKQVYGLHLGFTYFLH